MRSSSLSSLVVILLLAACGSNANRVCTPVPTFSSPAGECVALAEAPEPPPPPPPPKVKEPEPEPEPVPEPVPEPPPSVVVKAERIELDRTVQFETGSAKLVDDSKTLLGDVAKVLQEHPEIQLVQVEGHTDAVGSNRKNKKLSDKRAKAVRAFLIEQGVAKQRLVPKGFGEDKPVADNDTDDGRFKNRRVDLKILKRDESAVEPGAASDAAPKDVDAGSDQKPEASADDTDSKPAKKKNKKKKKAKKAEADE